MDYNVNVPDGCGVGLKKKLAVVSLLTGAVRGVRAEPPLDVIPDTDSHAEIVNLPPPGTMCPPEYDPRFLSVVSELIMRAVLRVEWSLNTSSS